MKKLINLQEKVFNLYGEVMYDKDRDEEGVLIPKEERPVLNAGMIVGAGLMARQSQGEKPATEEASMRRFTLAQKLFNKKKPLNEVEIDDDDYTYAKKKILEFQQPIIAGQVLKMIDPKNDEAEKEEQKELPENKQEAVKK